MPGPGTNGADDDVQTYLKSRGFGDAGGLPPLDRELIKERLESTDRERKATEDYSSKRQALEKEQFDEIRKGIAVKPPGAPKLPDAPQEQPQNPFMAFQNPAVFLAAMASLATRAPLTAAFNAGAAALKGFKEGDQQAIQQHIDNWKLNVEKAEKQNKLEVDAYNRVMENSKLSVAEKLAEMQALAAGYKDTVTVEALRRGDVDFINDLIVKRRDQGDKLEKAKIQMEILRERQKMMAEGRIEDEAMSSMVDRFLAGEKGVITNIGKGIQGGANLARFNNMLAKTMTERGLKPEDIQERQREVAALAAGATSEARAFGTRAAGLELISRNVEKAIPLAEEMSDLVPRGRWVPINKLLQAGASEISDVNLRRFRVANLQLAELWARAMNPTGVMRDADRELALANLSLADSPETYKAVLQTLRTAIEREREAIEEAKAAHTHKPRKNIVRDVSEQMAGRPSTPAPGAATPAPTAPAGAPAKTGAEHMSDEELAQTLGITPKGRPTLPIEDYGGVQP